jgi:glucose/mannose-6-phosphate isomerase
MVKYNPDNSLFSNPAKILAEKLHNKVPVIYVTEKLAGVGARAKAELMRTLKNFAFVEEFPELNHKSLEGLLNPKDGNF